MPIPTPPFIACAICGKPVEIETSKTDSHGEAVHEECYARKVADKKKPSAN